MMHWGRPAGLGLLAAALVLSGCSSDTESQPATDTAAETTKTTETAGAAEATTSPAPGAPASQHAGKGMPAEAVERALQAAGAAVPNGRPFDLEVESRDEQRVFVIDVASDGNEFEVRVSADGNEVVGQRQDDDPGDGVAKVQEAQVDAVRAMQTALEREPDAAVSDIQIDNERDAIVWQIELVRPDGSEVEIDVDARSGAIVGG
ncbi:PepSY domain-containing protein [[Mycobacterium] wendilense]|uniref:PepSY domain-containing protein n=1 Tax=[Mycobacterium] wendilense TaxID=3064284 RepID=A0ABM9MGT7_9MYCO|nr:PepSY domain-containing protein [Mycolicibacterium sp. MU0050]CAJ1584821.1 PepSY domain-containing protein [Mycolicibacterium sp. MU0050]